MRRRSRVPADPEVAEALAVLDRYRAMLEALREAGDRWAPQRLRMLAWNQRDIEAEGLDCISRLRVRGYAREVDRLTATTPEVLHPGTYAALLPPPDGFCRGTTELRRAGAVAVSPCPVPALETEDR